MKTERRIAAAIVLNKHRYYTEHDFKSQRHGSLAYRSSRFSASFLAS
jgi:hypothetical protein